MPFTPFHFGLNACAALPLRRHLDVPVFVLASVAVDVEPLMVMLFDLDYPLHGYCHTLLFGTIVGILWGLMAYAGRNVLAGGMKLLRLSYGGGLRGMLLSGVLGVWFHILLDAPLYADIRPFYPVQANPLYGTMTDSTIYLACTLAFVPALVLYAAARKKGMQGL
jgi:membrane-bound metal-dependent hydrolase YbcI (DUF457 family)